MADPPAYGSARFRHSGIRATPPAHGVFPSHRWFQRQLNTRLSRREDEGGPWRAAASGGEAKGARTPTRRARFPAIRSLAVARDALPGVIITCHCHPRDGDAFYEKTHTLGLVSREKLATWEERGPRGERERATEFGACELRSSSKPIALYKTHRAASPAAQSERWVCILSKLPGVKSHSKRVDIRSNLYDESTVTYSSKYDQCIILFAREWQYGRPTREPRIVVDSGWPDTHRSANSTDPRTRREKHADGGYREEKLYFGFARRVIAPHNSRKRRPRRKTE